MEAAPAAGKKAEDPPVLEPPAKGDAPKPTGAAAKLSADDLKAIKELPAGGTRRGDRPGRLPRQHSRSGLDGKAHEGDR